mgnify:CR=1 FL=1
MKRRPATAAASPAMRGKGPIAPAMRWVSAGAGEVATGVAAPIPPRRPADAVVATRPEPQKDELAAVARVRMDQTTAMYGSKEALFIELLEAVDPDDAKLLLAIKDKTLPYSGLDTDIINRAFPGLIPT